MHSLTADLLYQPRLPDAYRPGIGIIGCGGIVRHAHLPAYATLGLNIVGIYDPNPAATAGVQEEFGVGTVFGSLEDLLADPAIAIVDIATHAAVRAPIVHAALAAGKHVLAQKPLAPDLAAARGMVEDAARRGLKLAVNQNGRWAPPWRVATLLLERGAIGDVIAVTHLFEKKFGWIPGTPFDDLDHYPIYDYAIHWIDITRCWLDGKRVVDVRARDYRTPNQPPHSKATWGAWVEIAYADGTNAMIRSIGGAETARQGHLFWVHGTAGTIRGSVLGNDFVELERNGDIHRFDLDGHWSNDGFAGTMGELMGAIAEGREPFNSARHNLLTLALTFAACRSADADGGAVAIEEGT